MMLLSVSSPRKPPLAILVPALLATALGCFYMKEREMGSGLIGAAISLCTVKLETPRSDPSPVFPTRTPARKRRGRK